METEITQEDLIAKVKEWEEKRGKKASAADVRKIYQEMVAAGSALTDEEKKAAEKKENEPLTDTGLTALTGQLIAPTVNPLLAEVSQAAIPRTISGDYSNTIDPLTGKSREGVSQRRSGPRADWTYTGTNLVDEAGKISPLTATDNTGNNATNILFQRLKMDGTLPNFLNSLKAQDYYGDKSPSSQAVLGRGLTGTDYAAFDNFINSANLARYTPMAYLKVMEKMPAITGSGSGSSPAYPSSAETARYLRNAAFESLGRPLTKEEADMAFKQIKTMYMKTSGAGGEQAPSIDTASVTAVSQIAGEEGAVYNLGTALDRLFKGKGSI